MVSPRNTVQVPIEPALELVRKYNIPGPRYTSYPTAPQFSEAIDRPALLAEVALDNQDASSPLSLYFHLPFCESLCWYCGCTTVITKRLSSAGEYVGWLEKELALPRRSSTPPVASPSCISAAARQPSCRRRKLTGSPPRSTGTSNFPRIPKIQWKSTRAA